MGPGTSTWQTVLDLDFSGQISQSLATDGPKTIGGLVWTKSNSVNDQVPMALVNGSGVIIQPNSACDYHGGTRTCPMLSIPLSSLLAGISLRGGVRIWCYISADTLADDGYPAYENSLLAVDSGSMTWSWQSSRGVQNAGGGTFALKRTINNSSDTVVPSNVAAFASNQVHILEVPVLGGFDSSVLYGPWSAGWPALAAAIQPGTTFDNGIVVGGGRTEAFNPLASNMVLVLGAVAFGSASHPSFTIARIRVDVLPNQV